MPEHTNHSIAEFSRILTQIMSDVLEHKYLSSLESVKLSKTQFSILKILRISGPYLMREIADILQISRAAASKNTDKLVKLKLVNREIIEVDRRSTKITILAKGKNLVRRFEDIREYRQNAALSGFTSQEKRTLSELLGKYVRQCMMHEESMEIICLRCDSSIKDFCSQNDNEEMCRFYQRTEKKPKKI